MESRLDRTHRLLSVDAQLVLRRALRDGDLHVGVRQPLVLWAERGANFWGAISGLQTRMPFKNTA